MNGELEEEEESYMAFEADPLYGAELDDEDIEWLRVHSSGVSDLPSDAVLSCPACFTTLCLCSQRHEIYKEQYRAIFVMNCLIQKLQNTQKAQDEEDDGYTPVLCARCRLQVAYRDTEQVYHFYNVLPSIAK